ncbi:alpha-amylase family glycosyl hydrolase [Cnuibacter physcomitrellae]|uniref:alpha-amylase family glycosyl hydrolase n=1 Tax=Cnuibacter physcomitrellae TaxID=1619308 RepID=UPI00217612A4|nr:alpha-amylase family glycosyl hydrolase [Cnuibacter physcomitrellae]MCS5497345.1 alpha-amylase family glycosyl hydrolase [Cnuibacter physcomitrellae]
MTAAWTEHVLWWQVYPLGFVGAEIRPESPTSEVTHRLDRIVGWLDHVIELGLNGLQLGPVFASTSHGYDTVDHFTVDPRLGDGDDLDRLLAEARARGIRVLLDGVFNHVSRAHPWFADVEARGPESEYAGRFRIDWGDAPGWHPGDAVPAQVFEGHDALVVLNHDSATVRDHVVEIMSHWLDRGIDGWRLDAAYAVPASFWAAVLPRVRERHPEAWFSGEVIHGVGGDFVVESTIDSLTQYELWQGIWHSLSDRNLFELAHAVERGNELLRHSIPSTFIGNHDVTRIASAVGAELVPHAAAVLFTVAGVPSVYAGDEYAYLGVKEARLGGDDAVRPEFPSTPPAPGELSPEAAAVLRAHEQLIAVRRRHPWLHSAHTDVVELQNEWIVLRTATGSGAVVTALNPSSEPRRLPVGGPHVPIAGGATAEGDDLIVPPGGWLVAEPAE